MAIVKHVITSSQSIQTTILHEEKDTKNNIHVISGYDKQTAGNEQNGLASEEPEQAAWTLVSFSTFKTTIALYSNTMDVS